MVQGAFTYRKLNYEIIFKRDPDGRVMDGDGHLINACPSWDRISIADCFRLIDYDISLPICKMNM